MDLYREMLVSYLTTLTLRLFFFHLLVLVVDADRDSNWLRSALTDGSSLRMRRIVDMLPVSSLADVIWKAAASGNLAWKSAAFWNVIWMIF